MPKMTKNKTLNFMKNLFIVFILLFATLPLSPIHSQIATRDDIIFYTAEWTGERDSYGRPVVSDELLERIKNISIEEAWGVLRGEGYLNQFAGEGAFCWNDRCYEFMAY